MILALLAACLLEPMAAECVLRWDAATPGGCVAPCSDDWIAAYRIYAPSGRLCGVVHERRWTSRTGAQKRSDPATQWNPYASDSAECWPSDGESVPYCVRAVDAFGNESVNCSNVYTVVGVAMQCCDSTGCRACSTEGR